MPDNLSSTGYSFSHSGILVISIPGYDCLLLVGFLLPLMGIIGIQLVSISSVD
ncbi:MAG: hypothetical protein NZ901_09990 [Geminocystis sp.]|nr:hypothetical protein [Geminocystis sp.]MCS7148504.1 hypothetical protein [Geminocystis sp.]MCX8079460.1 hypothetical protein [Geminocystis sp.]MDW8464189.1 hypothetical protein [Geminocystis sp.]HIK37387.1 hypothetical protein [Geminocystis sp. M7585_C2015_104]